MPYASPADVESRLLRPLTNDEETYVPGLLSDVELLIKARISNLDEKVQSGEIDEAAVIMVESYAVARVLRNPEGFRREQDGDYSYSRDSTVASGRLHITAGEWRLLGVSAGAFTIAPHLPSPTPCYDPWRPL